LSFQIEMIKVLIAEDDLFGREQVKSVLQKSFPQIEIVAEAVNGTEAVSLIHYHKPDLVFLDIEMPHKTGFEVLESVNEPDFEVVFITAFDHYALRAIKFSALDYLLKPLNREEFIKAVEKFIEKQKFNYDKKSLIKNFIQNIKTGTTENFKLAVNTTGKTYFLDPDSIIRCEADGNYTRIYVTGSAAIFTARTLKEFDELLQSQGFIRVHRTHLVNKKHIRSLGNDNHVQLHDNSSLEVSRRKLAEVRMLLGLANN